MSARNREQRPKLVLLVGPKHSGKTTVAAALADRARQAGFAVAGLLAPGVRRSGELIGFDALDLRTGRRTPLARRGVEGSQQVGGFAFTAEGLALGAEAISPAATGNAELVIVDEFGPLELRGGGWRSAVDGLIFGFPGVLVLVVRAEMVAAVRGAYPAAAPAVVAADRAEAVQTILAALAARRSGPPGAAAR